jgi:hypothetical protein
LGLPQNLLVAIAENPSSLRKTEIRASSVSKASFADVEEVPECWYGCNISIATVALNKG